MIKQLVFGVVALSMIPSESESASIAEAGEFHTALSEQVCLANNIYWEARNQTEEGMIGVGLVVRNRVLDNRFPHSYCEVVHQAQLGVVGEILTLRSLFDTVVNLVGIVTVSLMILLLMSWTFIPLLLILLIEFTQVQLMTLPMVLHITTPTM